MITLSEDQKRFFAAFLQQEADNAERMMEQLAKLVPDTMSDAMSVKFKVEMVAFRLVANWLLSWESEEIKGGVS